MKIIFVIASLFVFPSLLFAQKSDTLPRQSIEIVNQFLKDKSHAAVLSGIEDHNIREMKEAIGNGEFIKNIQDENGNKWSEKLVLSKEEQITIIKALADMIAFRWSEKDAQKLELETVKRIAPDSSTGSSEVRAKYRIMPPVFIRDASYCFLYLDYACGPLCGGTRFMILKKTNEGWKFWYSLILSNA